MSITLINDWQYLFSKDAIGGRGAAFTLLNIGWMHTGVQEIDGFSVTILGLGARVKL